MASLAQLKADVMLWLNRQDVDAGNAFTSWVTLTEIQIAQTLRHRCMVTTADQAIDRPYIPLPPDFATLQSVRDKTSGEILALKDMWSGHWQNGQDGMMWPDPVSTGTAPAAARAYRLMGDCLEFLPHPYQPSPPDPTYQFQVVEVLYYAKPRPLLLTTDSNAVLEQLYSVYLYGCLKHGAIWAQDDNRAQQMDTLFRSAVTSADLHTQQSDFSGAPLTTELAPAF